ncbi:hypothetical protein F5890DRAFT_1635956 [Lentinula detonsa]|uniref:Uncharacterized protein n=1 Tax=Lentinula detonsa TaxID=2804962 RepID=A0AA38PPP6_9AGAR|nr:hypothetical protein F5890DRAFT_1635956 [Lentinula detonsa]
MVAADHPIALQDMQGQLHWMRWNAIPPQNGTLKRNQSVALTHPAGHREGATGEIDPIDALNGLYYAFSSNLLVSQISEYQARRSSFCFSQSSQVTSGINMRLLPSITSYHILRLSVYLLSAASLSIVVVANPIPISSQANSGPCAFVAGLEPQVVSQDSTNARHIQILPVAVPRTGSGKIDLKDFSAKPLIAHFVFEEFFWEHYNVIRDVDKLRTRTNSLLEEKAKGFKDFTIGDPNFQHPIVIEDDLDWINTVFLYFTLINQPGGEVPVLDAKQLGGWIAMFTKMTDLRSLHRKSLKPKALQ